MGSETVSLFSSLKAQKRLCAQFLPHLLPSKWPVQVASFHLQQVMMSLVGSTLSSAQGALVLVVPWMEEWMEYGLCCEGSSCCLVSWKALQKYLQLVDDASSVVRARPAPQAPTEDTPEPWRSFWVPKSTPPKPWKLSQASSALCETRAPLYLLPSANGSNTPQMS